MTFRLLAHVIDHWSEIATIGAMLQRSVVALTVGLRFD